MMNMLVDIIYVRSVLYTYAEYTMETSKVVAAWSARHLGEGLGRLLQQYVASVGPPIGRAPANIVQGATRMSCSDARVADTEPAGCVAADALEVRHF